MLTDDFLMRQIRMLEQLVVRLVEGGAGDEAETREDLEGAYQELLGIDPRLAARMSTESLRGLLQDRRQAGPLALLFRIHGDIERSGGRPDAARRLFLRALELLDGDDGPTLEDATPVDLRDSLLERLAD